MKTVFVDESGATGLVDFVQQPVFALSAVCIEEPSASALCEKYLPKSLTRINELKHEKLIRRGCKTIRAGLVAIQETVLNTYPAFSYVMEKRYMALLSLAVDFIPGDIPDVFELGRYAHNLLLKWEHLCGRFDLPILLQHYYDVITCNDAVERKDLFTTFREDARRALTKSQDVDLCAVLSGVVSLNPATLEEFEASVGTHDLSQYCIVGLVVEMARELQEPFKLILDSSYHDGTIGNIVSLLTTKLPGIVVASGNSKDYHGLQIADIMSGGARFAAELAYGKKGQGDQYGDYRNRVLSLYDKSNKMLWQPSGSPVSIVEGIRRLRMIRRPTPASSSR